MPTWGPCVIAARRRRADMSVISPGRNIVLIGLMGSGKSVVGKRVARRLERPFVDTDEVVEHEARRRIPEIFAEEGERGFREHEAAAVRQVSALRGQVIAVGGGAVLNPANVTQLRSTGDLVWLAASPEVLRERLERGGAARRPLLADADDLGLRIAALAEERRAHYERAADRVLVTDGRSLDQIADDVLEWARARPGLLAREERTP
jgi:shikimate kinase